ncbi:MAG: alpha-amylase family glycosyl hydrolase [Planctomycetota bacterium]
MNDSHLSDWPPVGSEVQLRADCERREQDWRCGPIVYHILVDRFVEPTPEELDAKRHFYDHPRTLQPWSADPHRGERVEGQTAWSHELAFWGGDLKTARRGLDHVRSMRADVVYLNPIHDALTNHKYDARDFFGVSPEYGTRNDVIALADDVHQRGMKIMLDGVFNHVGTASPWFQTAMANESSEQRAWFDIADHHPRGYRCWHNATNLPELELENERLRDLLWRSPDSVVRGYLRDGIDGWRLDVAYDLGLHYLKELNEAAKVERADSCVVGELWNDPEDWCVALDGVMNFHARQVILDLMQGRLSGGIAGRMLERMVDSSGEEAILRSWIILDNHDTARLHTFMPERRTRRTAQVLQFTLPGAPVLYYGNEFGQPGGNDPENRGPMRWDWNNEHNQELDWTRKLCTLRSESRALRVGAFRLLDTETLLAFMRRTDHVGETRYVFANPTGKPVTEVVQTREPRLMNFFPLEDEFTGTRVTVESGMFQVTVPPFEAMLLKPVTSDERTYSPYKRVR